jgi:hypothetical protein
LEQDKVEAEKFNQMRLLREQEEMKSLEKIRMQK